jgi:hypothetical protein
MEDLTAVLTNSGDAYLGVIVGTQIKDAVILSLEEGESVHTEHIRNYVASHHRGQTSNIDLSQCQFHTRELSTNLRDYYKYCLTVLEDAKRVALAKVEADLYIKVVR